LKITAFIQARMGSTRLPGKVLLPLVGVPMLWHIVSRVAQCPLVHQVVIVTGRDPSNNVLRQKINKSVHEVYSGADDDVLDRFYEAAMHFEAEHILRITADCPFIDPDVLTQLIKEYGAMATMFRPRTPLYACVSTGTPTNHHPGYKYPDGLDAEIFNLAALADTWDTAEAGPDREHVSLQMKRLIKATRYLIPYDGPDLGHVRLTVDTEDDYHQARDLYAAIYPTNPYFRLKDVLAARAQ